MTIADVIEGRASWHVEQGDCIDILRALPLKCVDHIITDPPYESEAHTKSRRVSRGGGSYKGKKKGRLENFPIDFDPMDPATRWMCGKFFARACRRWCLIFCQMAGRDAWQVACEKYGLTFRRDCIWVKPDSAPQFTGDRPGHGFENIVALHTQGKSRWNCGGRRGVFVYNCHASTRKPDEDHQTPKPVELMADLIESFTDPGDLILDPFCGSATTLLVALRLGRRAIGIERDPKYYKLSVDRCAAEVQGSTLQAARAGQIPLFGAQL